MEVETTYSGYLPPLLPLELRPLGRPVTKASSWYVAWIGAASQSTAIEVAEKLADCIGLPDFIQVQVRAYTDLPKATKVTLEPATEDDYAILALNKENAEEQILNQVGIVQEGLSFPFWLHGHTLITLWVASTEPKQSAVRLVPGIDVVVDLKEHIKIPKSNLTEKTAKAVNQASNTKASLRVQELDRSLVQNCEHRNIRFGVVPTSMAFVSSITAENFSLVNGQPVILTPIAVGSKRPQNNGRRHGRKEEQKDDEEEANHIAMDEGKDIVKQVICQLVLFDTVARGHVMLARSLRLYIGAYQHTRVVVKGCTWPVTKIPGIVLSPVYFKPSQIDKSNKEIDSDTLDDFIESEDKYNELDAVSKVKEKKFNEHKDIFSATGPIWFPGKEEFDAPSTTKSKNFLLQSWISSQISLLSNFVTGTDVGFLLIGSDTVLHFELNSDSERYAQKNCLAGQSAGTWQVGSEIMFLLSVDSSEKLQNGELQESNHIRKNLTKLNQVYKCERSILLDESEETGLGPIIVEAKLGPPLYLNSEPEKYLQKSIRPLLSSLTWMGAAASEALKRLTLLSSPISDRIFSNLCLPLPGNVLIYGPPASGKTQLALALARQLEEDPKILSHVVFVKCSELASEQAEVIRDVLWRAVSEALDHTPSILVLDDLDSAISSSSDSEGSEHSRSATGLAEFFADLIDACQDREQRPCGVNLIAFLAVVLSPGALPSCLCSSGRFDFHVQVPAPAVADRAAILKHEISRRGLQCYEQVTSETASKCDGYDTSDLEVLVDRAIHAAVTRSVSPQGSQELASVESKPGLLIEDFSTALENFLPAAMRGIAKSGSQGGRMGWEDVGGLSETRASIQEMLELPVKFSKIFSEAPLRLRSGILLYGPPGCGKTHIVGAAAAACSLRFISVKGPELLNKYIGASEQAVRDIFSKASAAAPCILFFDEFDSIAPKRGHDNTGVTDRVVNQLLTELDGVEALTGVFVFAATSRPDLLDPALLRPGRLDRLLFCGFPSARERLEILDILSRKLTLASDVDLGTIASVTEGFSGADLQALLSDAQLESVHGFLETNLNGNDGGTSRPLITNRILESVLAKARASVPEKEKYRLYDIYDQFLNSKTSGAVKARDVKGKRSTLA
ncbi:hypothetical protein SUGI_0392840 [Cryptomeria japonica]|nr:hypothetical protein SUGI_0392840 [Cryptomeria japonica]